LDAETGVRLGSCAYLVLRYFLRGFIGLSQLIPANRPGLAVAWWQIEPSADELILEIFQVPVGPGFLETIVFSVVLLRSGRSFGDSPEDINMNNPLFYGSSVCGRPM